MMKATYMVIGALLVIGAVAYPMNNAYADAGLTVDGGVVGLGGTVELTLTADGYDLTIPAAHWYKVYEPDGDRCVPNPNFLTFPYTIPDGSFLDLVYPTDFVIDQANGDGVCNTNNIGEYEVDVDAKTKIGTMNFKVDFDVSFFVLPESPIGAVAIIGSSIAALGAFMTLKRRVL